MLNSVSDHTSTDPDEAIRLSAKAIAKGKQLLPPELSTVLLLSCIILTVNIKGLKVVEAPLTGGLQLLKIGQMTVLAGGPADLINETTPLMKSYTGLLELMRSNA